MGILIRLLICILFGGLLLYKSIDRVNDLTELRLTIPVLKREVLDIQEKNTEMRYQIELFESPENLIELLKQPRFSHLQFPLNQEVVFISYESIDVSEEI